MKIADLLKKEIMIMDLHSTTKREVIDEMIANLKAKNMISDEEIFRREILNREEMTSTGLGGGVAMPHAKTSAVNTACVLFAKSAHGVDYQALDDEPVYLFFMIAAKEGAHNEHIETLAALSKLLIHPEFVEALKNTNTPEEVIALIEATEAAKKEKETAPNPKKIFPENTEKPLIVAVTACPTGIAHTYMAEDSLKEKAAQMGVSIRVETNGSDGAKNILTADEIARSVGVIVAADKNVEMEHLLF